MMPIEPLHSPSSDRRLLAVILILFLIAAMLPQ